MEKTNFNNSSVAGIIVPTKNRPDFVIRLLNYYADTNSPHTLYIGDSSDDKESKRIKEVINNLKNKINIVYERYLEGNSWQCMLFLFSIVKEDYVAYIGDDDYWIPGALSECVDFLKNNSDYETAIALSVTFKTKNNSAYGELKEIHDYKRYSIEGGTAHERLDEYLGFHMTGIAGAVIKTKHALKYYQDSYDIPDLNIRGEFLPSCFMIIAGKSKVIDDRLGFVRQIHDSHFQMSDIFDCITDDKWSLSYGLFRNRVVNALVAKDGIDIKKAEFVFKKGMWFYLQKYLPKYYNDFINSRATNTNTVIKSTLRTRIARNFPMLKRLYRKYKSAYRKIPQLHYEVLQPDSTYFEDFRAIVKSLNKNADS